MWLPTVYLSLIMVCPHVGDIKPQRCNLHPLPISVSYCACLLQKGFNGRSWCCTLTIKPQAECVTDI